MKGPTKDRDRQWCRYWHVWWEQMIVSVEQNTTLDKTSDSHRKRPFLLCNVALEAVINISSIKAAKHHLLPRACRYVNLVFLTLLFQFNVVMPGRGFWNHNNVHITWLSSVEALTYLRHPRHWLLQCPVAVTDLFLNQFVIGNDSQ